MKSQFFSSFSALMAIAVIIPAASLANTPTANVPSAPKEHQTLPFDQKTTDGPTPGTKQVTTTVPIFTQGGNSSGPLSPFPPANLPPESVLSLPVTTVTLLHTHRGASTDHTDQHAKYKTWGGSDWTASIDSSGEFTHTHRGANSGHTDRIIQYISWDGQPWSATVNPATGVFTHTRQGASSSHTDTILNYISWDGAHWTMRLQ